MKLLNLELQVIVNDLTWVLRTEFVSLGRAKNVTQWAITSAPNVAFLIHYVCAFSQSPHIHKLENVLANFFLIFKTPWRIKKKCFSNFKGFFFFFFWTTKLAFSLLDFALFLLQEWRGQVTGDLGFNSLTRRLLFNIGQIQAFSKRFVSFRLYD